MRAAEALPATFAERLHVVPEQSGSRVDEIADAPVTPAPCGDPEDILLRLLLGLRGHRWSARRRTRSGNQWGRDQNRDRRGLPDASWTSHVFALSSCAHRA